MLTIYSKDKCEYCELAKKFLSERNIEYEVIDMTGKDASELKKETRQNFFPFVFDKNDGTFIGGYFEVIDMFDF